MILQMKHSPIVPGPGDEVTVTARIIDEQSSDVSVRLYYRIDRSAYNDQYSYPYYDPADYNILSMFDDGFHNDGNVSDNIYGAQLPAHPLKLILNLLKNPSLPISTC